MLRAKTWMAAGLISSGSLMIGGCGQAPTEGGNENALTDVQRSRDLFGSPTPTVYNDIALVDVMSFTFQFGQTNVGWPVAYINYVDVTVGVPGVRVSAYVCADVTFKSEGRVVGQASKVCQSFGPGAGANTKTWRVYTPKNASSRPAMRRALSEIDVGFTYSAAGLMSGGCATSNGASSTGLSCGALTVRKVVQ